MLVAGQDEKGARLLTDVEDGHSQLDVAKVPGACLDVLFAGPACVHAVDGAELGVIQTLRSWLLLLFILRAVSTR